MTQPVLVSGIQPTGKLHIGNYLGALKHFVNLQNSEKYQCYFFIADYHSLTEDITDLSGKITDLGASYLAADLDPKRSVLFVQSEVPEHTELSWIFNTITPIGELNRMTQFKDKSNSQEENINAGLFTYPILMAADILMYSATFVPVGNDQDQHLELTRTLARKFNARYGKVFAEPKPLHTETPRIMSLQDPGKKMSKSDPKGCLFIDEEPKSIERKIKSAITDSGSEIKFDEKEKPAVSNLLRILGGISGKPIKKLEKEFEGMKYAEFKSALVKTITDYFAPIRERKEKLLKNPRGLDKIFSEGSLKAQKVAAKKLAEVKKVVYSK